MEDVKSWISQLNRPKMIDPCRWIYSKLVGRKIAGRNNRETMKYVEFLIARGQEPMGSWRGLTVLLKRKLKNCPSLKGIVETKNELSQNATPFFT